MPKALRIGTDIEEAARALAAGGLVAIPTETVYGLAGNALDEAAALRIFEVKRRPAYDPLIVHVSSLSRALTFVKKTPLQAVALAEAFWPGPLTLLLPRKPMVPDVVTAGNKLVGLRVPDHPLTLELLRRVNFPLAAPSANPFGYISPTTPEHVAAQLGGEIDYILDGGPCRVGLESTIVGFPDGKPTVYRVGGLPVEAIEALVGKTKVQINASSNPQAPGALKSHYAPKTPFFTGAEERAAYAPERTGRLVFERPDPAFPEANQFVLSEKGDLEEAARNLYAAMRLLDERGFDAIFADWLPKEGPGAAINDRLRRAAARG